MERMPLFFPPKMLKAEPIDPAHLELNFTF